MNSCDSEHDDALPNLININKNNGSTMNEMNKTIDCHNNRKVPVVCFIDKTSKSTLRGITLAHLKNCNDAAASTTRLLMHRRLCWLWHESTEGCFCTATILTDDLKCFLNTSKSKFKICLGSLVDFIIEFLLPCLSLCHLIVTSWHSCR